jgi:hypothetical protein
MESRVESMVKMINEILVGKPQVVHFRMKYVDCRMVLRQIQGRLMFQRVEGIQLSQDRFRWRIFIKNSINFLGFPENVRFPTHVSYV